MVHHHYRVVNSWHAEANVSIVYWAMCVLLDDNSIVADPSSLVKGVACETMPHPSPTLLLLLLMLCRRWSTISLRRTGRNKRSPRWDHTVPVCLVHKLLLPLVLQARLENIRLQNKTQKLEALIKQKVTHSTSWKQSRVISLMRKLEIDLFQVPRNETRGSWPCSQVLTTANFGGTLEMRVVYSPTNVLY